MKAELRVVGEYELIYVDGMFLAETDLQHGACVSMFRDIARIVNAHDALQTALQAALCELEFLDDPHAVDWDSPELHPLNRAKAADRAALAKAKAE